ncbi:GGDEF domain-containing protein [Clostridium chrysemydis]|uniref:GGDEF domain-containing protein n=1 Tax=Clostridium chrysemydis TaxID=2665504 RepID=UPI0018846780|nr:GGDEF domain-containing protein [Clostridium chrysemydis]
MRVINGKYKIIDKIREYGGVSEYKVSDIEKDNYFTLSICNNEIMNLNLRNYLCKNFKSIRNLNCIGIFNIFDLININSIDGIVIENKQYGFLSEYFSDIIDINDRLSVCTKEEKIKVFMKIAANLNTINRKGYVYKDITLKNIKMVSLDDKRYIIKLPSVLSVELNNMENLILENSSNDFRENIILGEKENNLLELMKIYKEIFINDEIDRELDNIIKDQINDKYNIDRFYTIDEFITFINKKLGKRFPRFHYKSINKIIDDIDVAGRNIEIDNIMKKFLNSSESGFKSKFMIYNGVLGTGKTKFLEEIKARLKFVYNIPVLQIPKKKNLEEMQKTKKAIISEVYRVLNIDIGDNISRFVDNLSNKNEDYNLEETRINYQIMNDGIKILEKYTKNSKVVILIDNLEKHNMFLKMYVKHLASNLNRINNILVIATIESYERDTELERMVGSLKSEVDISEYKLDLFNEYYTRDMVSKMLNSNKDIDKISKLIHEESLGNPGMISERIRDLFSKGKLYVSGKTGYWISDFGREIERIPKRFEVDYKDKLNIMEEDEFLVLKRLSTFNFPISEELILNDILPKKEEYVYAYYRIKEENILIQNFTDLGVTIGFKDYFYKRMIYKNIDKIGRKKIHRQNLLCLKSYENSNNYYIEEVIYQLEQAEEFESMVEKGLEYGEKLSKEGDESKAIDVYKNILTHTKDKERCVLCYKIAALYRKVEYYNESYTFYSESRNLAKEYKLLDIEIKSIIFMAYIQIERRRFEKVSGLLNDIKYLLNGYDYPLGKAYVYYIKALYMYNLGLREEASDISKIGLEVIKGDGLEVVRARLCSFLFRYNIESSRNERTLKDMEYCLDIFLKNGDWQEYLSALINTGIYLAEVSRDFKQAESIFKRANKEGKSRNIIRVQFKALINLSHLKIYEGDYKEAENLTEEAISLIKSSKVLENYILVAYWNLIYISALSGKIIRMIKLRKMVEGQEDINKLTNRYVINLELVKSNYYFYLGDFEKARLEAKKLSNGESLNTVSNILYNLKYKLMQITEETDEEEIIETVKSIMNLKEDETLKRIIARYFSEVIVNLYKLNRIDLAKKLISIIGRHSIDITTLDEAKYVEIQFVYREYGLNTLINRALRIIGFTKSENDKLNLNYMIGKCYENIGSSRKSIYYYYEAFVIVSRRINSINEGKLKFINLKSNLNIFNSLTLCIKNVLGKDFKIGKVEEFRSLNDYYKFINEMSVNNLFKINNFRETVIEDYQNTYYNYNNDIKYVLNSFSDNILNNIELILKYIANKTLSTSALLTYNDLNGENKILASYRIKEEKFLEKRLNKNIKVDEIIVNENSLTEDTIGMEPLDDDIKSCLYINIKSKIGSRNKHVGQLLVLADKAINNINYESKKEIKELEAVLIFLIEQYKINLASTRDKLTGAYNRAYFEKAYSDIIDYSNYKNAHFSLVIFDIDNFKGVNDKYGHPVGDVVLKNISDIVSKNKAKDDIFCRYGGEEFVIILPLKDEKLAFSQAELIRHKIEEADILKGKRELTISLGIATYNVHSKNKNDLIKMADEALYEAKKTGKNKVKVWETEFSKQSEYNDKLAGILTGNAAYDYDKVSSMIEMLNITKSKNDKITKIYEMMKKLIIKTDSTESYIFFVEHDRILDMKRVVKDFEGFSEIGYFNKDIIREVRINREGIYTIDWEEIKEVGSLETIPKWHSICVLPLIKGEKLKGILYFSAPAYIKEFDFKDFNYIQTLSDYISILL